MTLEIDNVELYFSGKKILGGIYLKAETGSLTGILGRNGSGKSSLLKIIFGDLKSKYGMVRIDGRPILKPLYKSKIVGYLPQHNYLPPYAKLKTVFKLYKTNWVDFINDFEGFRKYEKFKVKELSGGEQRLVETYLILKNNYKVVLLDEPFSHLSPIYLEKIIDFLQTEKHKKVIILTDHMHEYITDVSDYLYLIRNNCTILMDDKVKLKDYGYLS